MPRVSCLACAWPMGAIFIILAVIIKHISGLHQCVGGSSSHVHLHDAGAPMTEPKFSGLSAVISVAQGG